MVDSEELKALFRLIKYSQDFSIGYARCENITLRQTVVKKLKPLLLEADINLLEINLTSPINNLREVIKSQVKNIGKSSVFVYGLEHSLEGITAPNQLLGALNMEREWFPRDIPHPIIFWLPSSAIDCVARFAPDFFAWRSGIYNFE